MNEQITNAATGTTRGIPLQRAQTPNTSVPAAISIRTALACAKPYGMGLVPFDESDDGIQEKDVPHDFPSRVAFVWSRIHRATLRGVSGAVQLHEPLPPPVWIEGRGPEPVIDFQQVVTTHRRQSSVSTLVWNR